jgi:molybdopterin/thiamine biosynthesis adenylyltransferase
MRDIDISLSRPEACAQRIAAHAADAHRFSHKRVLITGDAEILATANGWLLLLDSIRLVIRFCRHVDVGLPSALTELREEATILARQIEFIHPVNILESHADFGSYDAILSVGAAARGNLPWTTINCNGWLARVSSTGKNLNPDCSQTNPIGALAAASLGASEVFKRLVGLKPERGPFFDDLRFSCYSFEVNTDDPGPLLPESIQLPETLVVGQGAIGNGITLVLSQLPCAGTVMLLDSQKYGPENLGTCILLGKDGINEAKADWNANRFSGSQVNPIPIVGKVEEVLPHFGTKYSYPSVILNGLDNVFARHDIQDLWPDIIIDGAIGDFPCQVVSHVWGRQTACLKCLFSKPSTPDPVLVASSVTGLSPDKVREAEAVVTDEDVQKAPTEKQALLGRKVCSVVSEQIIAQISAAKNESNFSPSTPFVATMSSAMVVGTLIKYLAGESQNISSRFYFDILQGPQQGEHFREMAKSECSCHSRKKVIAKWRASRSVAARSC